VAKYNVGQKLKDIEDDVIIKILMVAPSLDYDGEQHYFAKVETVDSDGIDIEYYSTYEEEFLSQWTKEYK